MELRDFIVAPIIAMLVFGIAFFVRPHVTDLNTRRYFFPAIALKMMGAIALGLVYQYYYLWGDTYNYHTNGSRVVWESFMDDPANLLRFVFGSAGDGRGIYQYSSRIMFFQDPNSYFVVRVAGLLDVLTFSSYTGTAILFSVISFIGSWMMFQTFYQQYPHLHRGLAIATLFIPSMIFWGSGILKDTLIMSCVGIATFQFYRLFIAHRFRISYVVLLLAALYVIFKIRVFVLQAYLPAVILWVGAANLESIRSVVLKVMIVPFAVAIILVAAYFVVARVAEDDKKYSVANLAKTSRITAYDIGFYTGRGAGSNYSLEVEDWTPLGMVRSAPAAVNVSLFRPYLWEVRNFLMLISSTESTILLFFTIYVVFFKFRGTGMGIRDTNVIFCLAFAITFAFAVGISTFNFGTLTRYRILLLPFFAAALVILNDYASNRDKKFEALEVTE